MYIPIIMAFICLAARIKLRSSQLKQSFVEFPGCPVVSARNEGQCPEYLEKQFLERDTNCLYELSPKPKVVKFTSLKTVGGSLLERSLFHKSREFFGISPWPVVEMTKMTSGY
jgi:hypothetical protein